MTAHRMMDLDDNTIGFEPQNAPVTNTFSASRGPDGTVPIAFCSEWAQAGASHSTDGALVLSRVDAEALARVLMPGLMVPSEMPTLLRRPISAANPLPPGCHCSPGHCQAPRIMGRQTPCRDPAKRDAKLCKGN